MIDLNPFAAQHRQAVGYGQEPLDLLGRKILAVERHFDREIEQLVSPNQRRRLGADGGLDPRPARAGAWPASRHAHDEARLL